MHDNSETPHEMNQKLFALDEDMAQVGGVFVESLYLNLFHTLTSLCDASDDAARLLIAL
jgi:hypothetical protein